MTSEWISCHGFNCSLTLTNIEQTEINPLKSTKWILDSNQIQCNQQTIFQNACESSPFSQCQRLVTAEVKDRREFRSCVVQLVLQRSLAQRQRSFESLVGVCMTALFHTPALKPVSAIFLLISGWIMRRIKRWNTSSSTLWEMDLTACAFSKAGLNKSKQTMSVRRSLPVYFHKSFHHKTGHCS